MNYDTQQFELVITLRLKQLHRQGFEGITYEDLSGVFIKYIWKRTRPQRLSDAVDQILGISSDDIVRYLSLDSQINGKNSSLEEFASMFKG